MRMRYENKKKLRTIESLVQKPNFYRSKTLQWARHVSERPLGRSSMKWQNEVKSDGD